AAAMPGVKMHAFSTDDLPVTREGSSADPGPIGQAAGLAADHRATILLADPFSSPLNVLLPLMAAARHEATGHKPDPNYAGSLLEALEEILDSLGPAMRERLRRGLFIGRAINEYKDRFGRDDFLIRNVIGVDKEHKAIAVADLLRIGQTIQFHVRDAQTAAE